VPLYSKINLKRGKITMNENKKSLQGMSKSAMKKMCEDLKSIGTKYEVNDSEKAILNNIMFCIQIGWEQINVNENNLIQM